MTAGCIYIYVCVCQRWRSVGMNLNPHSLSTNRFTQQPPGRSDHEFFPTQCELSRSTQGLFLPVVYVLDTRLDNRLVSPLKTTIWFNESVKVRKIHSVIFLLNDAMAKFHRIPEIPSPLEHRLQLLHYVGQVLSISAAQNRYIYMNKLAAINKSTLRERNIQKQEIK